MSNHFDIIPLIFAFLAGILICCILKNMNTYEGFEYNNAYNDNIMLNKQNLDVDGKKGIYNCELFTKPRNRNQMAAIYDQNVLWWNKNGWYITIMNDPSAYEEMKRDFEADITDPLLPTNLKKGKSKAERDILKLKNERFYDRWKSSIDKIKDMFEKEIIQIYDSEDDKQKLDDPMFLSPVTTREEYLNNFKRSIDENVDALMPTNNLDDESLWTSYKNGVNYIIDIYDMLSDSDGQKVWVEAEQEAERVSSLARIPEYDDMNDASSQDKLIDELFPNKVNMTDDTHSARGKTTNPACPSYKGLAAEKANESSSSESCGFLYLQTCKKYTYDCVIKYRSDLLNKVNKIKELIKDLGFRKVGYMEEYNRLLDLGYDGSEKMEPYLNLFENILNKNENIQAVVGVELNEVMIREWGMWVTTFGEINNKRISQLYNIPSNKDYDDKCSQENQEKRCYFNSGVDRDLGLKHADGSGYGGEVVNKAWGQMYLNGEALRETAMKSYLPPYLVQSNNSPNDHGQLSMLKPITESECNTISEVGWRYTPGNDPGTERDAKVAEEKDGGPPKKCFINGRSGSGDDKNTPNLEIDMIPDYRNCEKYSPINEGDIEGDIEEDIEEDLKQLIDMLVEIGALGNMERDTIKKYIREHRDAFLLYLEEYKSMENLIDKIMEYLNIDEGVIEGYTAKQYPSRGQYVNMNI
jgi:hypothetical protein